MSCVQRNRLDIKGGREGNEFKVRIVGIEFFPLFHAHILDQKKT